MPTLRNILNIFTIVLASLAAFAGIMYLISVHSCLHFSIAVLDVLFNISMILVAAEQLRSGTEYPRFWVAAGVILLLLTVALLLT